MPHTKVAFELAGDHARIRKAGREAGESPRRRLVIEALRGIADVHMTTDEIMALTRGDARPRTIRTGATGPGGRSRNQLSARH